LNIKRLRHNNDGENTGPGLGQAQKCGEVKTGCFAYILFVFTICHFEHLLNSGKRDKNIYRQLLNKIKESKVKMKQ
jgi:hypothetical protein